MFKKMLPVFWVLVLILFLSGCGEQSQTNTPLNVKMLDDFQVGTLIVDGEDDYIYTTREEVKAVIEQLKEDFTLMQEIEAEPEEQAQMTLTMDTPDKKRLDIAVFDGNEELLIVYIKNTDDEQDKDFFSLQSYELREKIDDIYARILYLRENPKGQKETLTFAGENANWQAVLTVENTYYEKAEDNPRGYEQEEDGTFVLQYKGPDAENVGRFNFRYVTGYRSQGIDNALLEEGGKITTYIKSSTEDLFSKDDIITVWIERNGKREKFEMSLVE
mgnify:CR=1 FL=1